MTSEGSESNSKESIWKKIISKIHFFSKNSSNKNSIQNIFENSFFENLEPSKQKMIKGVIKLSSQNVRDIMIPRVDVLAIPAYTSIERLQKLLQDKGYSRIPVYKDTIDNITGILYAKDLLKYLLEKSKKINIEKIIRKPLFVPETMLLDDLLVEFKKEKLHLAIVVDEYGGFAGIITLEDILEEIVGNIVDEYDEELPDVKKIGKNIYSVDSRMTISDLNEETKINLPTEEFDTIGGFVFGLFGEIPKKNETIKFNNLSFKINDIKGTRINKIILTIPDISNESR